MNEAPARVTPKPLTQEIVPPMLRYSSTPERFWSKVAFTDSCWLWQGAGGTHAQVAGAGARGWVGAQRGSRADEKVCFPKLFCPELAKT